MFDADHTLSAGNSLLHGDAIVCPVWTPEVTPTIADEVFASGYEFDFFQAVSLLESIYPDRQSVGLIGRREPAVRFASRSSSHSFAASSIFEVLPATTRDPVAKMTVGFMGLTGPSGVLPQHYTETLRRIELEAKGPQKYALRDWFDLFNDRLIALFYRSWKKYRPYTFHAAALRGSEDGFSSILQSVAGLGLPSVAHQVQKFAPRIRIDLAANDQQPTSVKQPNPNLSMLRYSGLLSQRPRSASNLKQLLEDYFELPIEIKQFHGNWLMLDESAQTQLGVRNGNSILGQNAVVGDQTWERQNKILIVVGPLDRKQFTNLMPDHVSDFEQNDFELLTELIRLFVGPEMEFDVQMKLSTTEMPEPKFVDDDQAGMRLGWNSWLGQEHEASVVSDAVFCVE